MEEGRRLVIYLLTYFLYYKLKGSINITNPIIVELLQPILCFTGDTPGDYKDLKPNNTNIKVEDGTLSISNIQKTNEGYYLCEAVNGIGSGLSAVILVSVQGKYYIKFINNLKNFVKQSFK